MDQAEFSRSLGSKRLISESEWMRVYELGDGRYYHVSKFVTDGLEVKAERLRSEWPTYSPDERRGFVEAYSVKPTLSDEDFEIFHFLMENGTDETWGWIAIRLTDLPDRDRVLAFLLDRIESRSGNFPNYVQAVEALGNSRAIGPLKRHFERLGERVARLRDASVPEAFFELVCYISCCAALIKLAGLSEAESSLASLERFPDERIQAIAKAAR